MADPLDVQHKIILEYEEQVKSSILPHLEALKAELGLIKSAFASHSKGVGGASSDAKSASRSYQMFARSSSDVASQMKGMGKEIFGAGKFLGYAVIAGKVLNKTLEFLYKNIKAIASQQAVFVQLAAQTGAGAEAANNLKSAYWNVTKASGAAAVSIRGLTESMAQFAAQGFPQQLMASGQSVTGAVLVLENALVQTAGVSAQEAKKMALAATGSFKGNIPALKLFLSKLNDLGNSERDVASGVKQITGEFYQLNPQGLLSIIGAMKGAEDQANGVAGGGAAISRSWTALAETSETAFDNLGQILVDTFGGDLASVLDSATEKLKEIIGVTEDWTQSIQDFYTGSKVYVHNYVEVWVKGWKMVEGIGAMTFSGLTVIASEFLSWLPGEWGKAGDAMQKWAIEVGRAGQKAFGYSMDFQYVDEEIANARARQTRSTKENLTPLQAIQKRQQDIIKGLDQDILPGVQAWTEYLKKAASSTQMLAQLTDLVGSSYEVMGKRIGNLSREIGQAQLDSAKQLLDASSDKSLLEVMKLIRSIQEEIALKGEDVSTKQRLAEAEERRSKILAGQVEAYSTLKRYLKDYVKDIDASLRLTEKSRQLSEAQLKVTQAVYGTPALAVQAQLAIVKTMEREKNLLKAKLAGEQEAIANMSEADKAAGNLQFAQEALLKTQTEITNKTAAQLEIVKQLRDGYLDAVKAQALGAGRFSKILITQEQNVMRGLKNRVAKGNYLMGLYGKAAGAGNAQSMRFSDSRLGLETMSGQEVTPEMARREQEARMAGAGAGQSAVGREANDIVMGIVSSASQETTRVLEGQTKQTEAFVGAIGHLASSSVGTAYAAGGKGRPGETRVGEAMRTGKIKDFNAGAYLDQTDDRGSSEASQNAFLRFKRGGKGTSVVPNAGPPGPGEAVVLDVAAVNRFNVEALDYYVQIIDAINACCASGGLGGGGGSGGGVARGGGGGRSGGGMSTGTGLAIGGALGGAGLAVGGLGVGAGLASGGSAIGAGLAMGGMGGALGGVLGIPGKALRLPGRAVVGGAKLVGRGVAGGARLAGRGVVGGARLAGRGAMYVAPRAANLAAGGAESAMAALMGETAIASAAVGTAAAGVAAASIYTLGKSIQTSSDEKIALRATGSAMNERLLFETANYNKTSNDELIRLIGERQAVDARLLTNAPSGIQMEGGFSWLAQKLGFMGEGPMMGKEEEAQVEKLRDYRRSVQEKIDVLQANREADKTQALGPLSPPVQMSEAEIKELVQGSLSGFTAGGFLGFAPSPMGPPAPEPMMGPPASLAPMMGPPAPYTGPPTIGRAGGSGMTGGAGGGGGTMTTRMMMAAKILMEIAGVADDMSIEQNNTTEYANNRTQTIMPPN